MIDTGVFVLLQVRKLFLSHIDHDCGLAVDEKIEDVSMRKYLRGGVVSLVWSRSWKGLMSRNVSKFLGDATPRLGRHFAHLAPTEKGA